MNVVAPFTWGHRQQPPGRETPRVKDFTPDAGNGNRSLATRFYMINPRLGGGRLNFIFFGIRCPLSHAPGVAGAFYLGDMHPCGGCQAAPAAGDILQGVQPGAQAHFLGQQPPGRFFYLCTGLEVGRLLSLELLLGCLVGPLRWLYCRASSCFCSSISSSFWRRWSGSALAWASWITTRDWARACNSFCPLAICW